MGLINPTAVADVQFESSQTITLPLVSLILEKKYGLEHNLLSEMKSKKAEITRMRRAKQESTASDILDHLTGKLKRNVQFAQEKGASIWLTSLPMESHGFALNRNKFQDAIALRYGWTPDRLPLSCACDATFSVEHALSCPKGAFPTHRHNELRDITATVLAEVFSDVSIEPTLQPCNGLATRHATAITDENARVDVRVRGFWGLAHGHQNAYLDVKVFNPSAPSYRKSQPQACYSQHERIKKRAYEQRINEIEHGSFTPLIFSTTGGMGKAATVFYKRLASKLAEKRKQPYSLCIRWLRCQLNFSLIRSSIMCLRGSRYRKFPSTPDSLLLAISESKI